MPVLSWLLNAGRNDRTRNDSRTAEDVPRGGPDAESELDPAASPSPSARPHSLRYLSPTGPALRANPFPEVTDLICRLPLPTLFYRLEAIHLGDLLRMMGTIGLRKSITAPSDFQGPARALRTPQEPWRFAGTTTLSLAEPIPGCPSLKKKRKLFPGLSPTSPSSFALPRLDPEEVLSPSPGSGILTGFPFDLHASLQSRYRTNCFRTAFAYSLRID